MPLANSQGLKTASFDGEESLLLVRKSKMTAVVMQDKILEYCREVFRKEKDELTIAEHIKKFLDERFGERWHVIVGNTTMFITHDEGCYLWLQLGGMHFCWIIPLVFLFSIIPYAAAYNFIEQSH